MVEEMFHKYLGRIVTVGLGDGTVKHGRLVDIYSKFILIISHRNDILIKKADMIFFKARRELALQEGKIK